jgi:hypothetical protein
MIPKSVPQMLVAGRAISSVVDINAAKRQLISIGAFHSLIFCYK